MRKKEILLPKHSNNILVALTFVFNFYYFKAKTPAENSTDAHTGFDFLKFILHFWQTDFISKNAIPIYL